MNICVLIDAWEPIWGGGQVHVWNLALQMAKNGDTITIFTRKLSHEYKKKSNKGIDIVPIGPLLDFFNPIGRLFWLLYVIPAVFFAHRKKRFDIIHAHAYTAGIPGKILGLILKIPVVFTVHGANNMDLGRKNIITFLEWFLLTRIRFTKVISVSKSFLKYSNVNAPISIIPNGISLEEFKQIKVQKKSKQFTVLWVGRFDKIKAVDILLNAFADFVQKIPSAKLVLVGYGYEEENLRKQVKILQLPVRFAGKQLRNDLIKWYKRAHILILSSLSEGFPITLLEAWSAKLPVVATRVGDIPYLIEDGKDGFLVSPGNEKELVSVLTKAFTSKRLTKMGESGYKKVARLYTWEKIAEQTKKVYQEVLHNEA